jgi:hypothetical protein
MASLRWRTAAIFFMEANWREIDAISNQNIIAHSEAIFPALPHRL